MRSLFEAQLEQSKLENAELKAAAAQQKEPLELRLLELSKKHDDMVDHLQSIEAQLKLTKLENAELKAAAAPQMQPLLNLGGRNLLELSNTLRVKLETATKYYEKRIVEIHACRFESDKIILGANKALEDKVELLSRRLAEIAPGPDGNLSLIIHGPRKSPLPEQQQEPPEPAPESQDADPSFPPGTDRFGNPHGSSAWLAAAFAEQQEVAEQSAEQQEAPFACGDGNIWRQDASD